MSQHPHIRAHVVGAAPASDWSSRLGGLSGAWISENKLYRLLLWSTFLAPDSPPPLVFGMLNPSTATHAKTDPTWTRCLGFARRERAGGAIAVNLSPFIATDPVRMELAHRDGLDVLLPEINRAAIEAACAIGPMVLAWGAGVRPWMDGAARMMRSVAGYDARCLGRTKMGEPRHPLMLASTTPMETFARVASLESKP